MTYEEYKNNGNKSKKHFSVLKIFLSKLFTVVIFSMIVIIISNYNENFKNFIINDVLNKTIDFSSINKKINKVTNVFDNENTLNVMNEIKDRERYKDGYKYLNNGDVYLKSSGIVTFIGEKEGYGNTVIIQQSDGYYAWYGNVLENIKLYDYIEAGNSIGTSEGEYYYVLLKDDKPIIDEN